MMTRIDRLMGLLMVLQSRKYISAEKLAEKFDISLRTVYRDLKALNEIGVPVIFEVNKGYFVAQGYMLPPLLFTAAEANAILLLQTLATRFAAKSITKHSIAALNKIKSALQSHNKEAAADMAAQTAVHISEQEQRQHTWLTAIQGAIARKYCLEIAYTDNSGNHTHREIEPIGLVFYTNQWHLIAWCDLRIGYRDFKVPMITELVSTTRPFTREHTFKMEDYIRMF